MKVTVVVISFKISIFALANTTLPSEYFPPRQL